MPRITHTILLVLAVASGLRAAASDSPPSQAATAAAPSVSSDDESITIATATYRIRIELRGFRYSFSKTDGTLIAAAHAQAGLQFAGADAAETVYRGREADAVFLFDITNTAGRRAEVRLTAEDDHLKMAVKLKLVDEPGAIVLRTGGVAPAFGMGDHGGLGRTTTELTGFTDEACRAMTGGSLGDLRGVARLVSNFVIFPRQGLAEISFEPGLKIIRLTQDQNAQGSSRASQLPAMYYFFGPPKTIYSAFLEARRREGYPVFAPKYEWFGVGWEAWGALAWDTSEQTVTDNIDRYLDLGYPLSWMVIGSGFWPQSEPRYAATTSFGLWDPVRYPDPRGMIEGFHRRGLKFIIGLRIAFITDGPFADEGLARCAFIEENGQAKVFTIGFPKSPCYLLDAHKPDAVRWYIELCRKWLDAGVDGFKEDLFGYQNYVLADDKIDPVNTALMNQGV